MRTLAQRIRQEPPIDWVGLAAPAPIVLATALFLVGMTSAVGVKAVPTAALAAAPSGPVHRRHRGDQSGRRLPLPQ